MASYKTNIRHFILFGRCFEYGRRFRRINHLVHGRGPVYPRKQSTLRFESFWREKSRRGCDKRSSKAYCWAVYQFVRNSGKKPLRVCTLWPKEWCFSDVFGVRVGGLILRIFGRVYVLKGWFLYFLNKFQDRCVCFIRNELFIFIWMFIIY